MTLSITFAMLSFSLPYWRPCDILYICCVFVNSLLPLIEHKFHEGSSMSVSFPVEIHYPEEYLAGSSCSTVIISLTLNVSALQCGFNFPIWIWIWHWTFRVLAEVGLRGRACSMRAPERNVRGLTTEVPKCCPWQNRHLSMEERDQHGQILRVFI